MKKLLRSILSIALVLGTLLALTACAAKPELDLEKAETALEAKDYTVFVTGGALEGLTGVKKSLNAYDENGNFLSIVYTEKADEVDKLMQEAKDEIADAREELEDEIADIREELRESGISDAEKKELEDAIAELEKQLDAAKKYVYGKADGVFWYGTADAIKATK